MTIIDYKQNTEKKEEMSFYYVFNKKGYIPRKKYFDLEEAEEDAIKMAAEHGGSFVVLQAISKVSHKLLKS